MKTSKDKKNSIQDAIHFLDGQGLAITDPDLLESSIDEYLSMLEEQHLAFKRKDLSDDAGIPVGDEFVTDRGVYPYRWNDEDTLFEIKHNGEWKEAQSIDWDFV